MSDEKRGFSPVDAAEYIGRSESYLRRLKRNNLIPAKRDGKALVFLREDLDAWLDALEDAK